MSLKEPILSIDISINCIDIKGQYITLAAPIQLMGQLNTAKLITERQSFSTSNESLPSLQIGVDEAGRGPLLGSVNVAATILPNSWSGLIEDQPLINTPLSILTDSKKLSEKKRNTLYPLVQQYALSYIIADIPAAVIDQLNILQATMLGMRLCTESLVEAIAVAINDFTTSDIANGDMAAKNQTQALQVEALFDGNRCPDLDYARLTKVGLSQSAIDSQAWVKGDARHTSIAAASILAKVSRDQVMYQLHKKHPEYDIAKHKGYPTKGHLKAIDTHGILAEHRRSFAPVAKKLAESE